MLPGGKHLAFTNFFGEVLPITKIGANKVTWVDPTEALFGSLGDDRILGGGGGHLMTGLTGDDTYTVKATGDQIVEALGGGVDTAVVSKLNIYFLPDFVENLTIGGRATAYGNAHDNVMIGTRNGQVLDGLAGNDILVGGDGADVFQFGANSGFDVIADFDVAQDRIRLDTTTLLSWSKVKAAMTQDGADVILHFGPDNAVRIQNTTVASFSANDFEFRIDTAKLAQTFADEFTTTPSFYDAATGAGVWAPNFNHGSPDGPKSRLSHTNNDEQQIYVDPTYAGSGQTPLGLNPFSVSDGVLTIKAEKTPTEDLGVLWNQPYTSGLLTTADTFYQQYGYFEMRAAMPTGKGVWPAFWLLPKDQSYGLEVDVTELVGSNMSYQTAHYWQDGIRTKSSIGIPVDDVTQFHTYGLLWTAQEIAWYIDGVEVNSMATPADLNKPMYILANLALGGKWAGPVPADFVSAEMKIDFIHAYSVDPDATAATVNAMPPNVGLDVVGTDAADTLSGQKGDDHLQGMGGDDVLSGGLGADHLDGGAGVDTATYASAASGVAVDLAMTIAQYTAGAGVDTLTGIENLVGSAFDDALGGDAGANTLSGGLGDDVLSGGGGDDLINGGEGQDTAGYRNATAGVTVRLDQAGPQDTGGAGVDTLVGIENLTGSGFADNLIGDSGANRLDGGAGMDTLFGGAGADTLIGGAGGDLLTGGSDADAFMFILGSESKNPNYDTITDFSRTEGDLIDLIRMDANKNKGGDQNFTFIGADRYSFHSGELRYVIDATGVHVYADLNGDSSSDFHLFIQGATDLLASDFIL